MHVDARDGALLPSGHLVPQSKEHPTDEVLRAIAEPNRRAILLLVADQERSAGDIAAQFPVTRTAISQHLTVLKASGLLTERRDGARRLYRARPEGLAELRAFLARMWPDALDRFRALAEATAPLPDADAPPPPPGERP